MSKPFLPHALSAAARDPFVRQPRIWAPLLIAIVLTLYLENQSYGGPVAQTLAAAASTLMPAMEGWMHATGMPSFTGVLAPLLLLLFPYYTVVIHPRYLDRDPDGFARFWFSLGWKRHLRPLFVLPLAVAILYWFFFHAPSASESCVGLCLRNGRVYQAVYLASSMLLAAVAASLVLRWALNFKYLHLSAEDDQK